MMRVDTKLDELPGHGKMRDFAAEIGADVR